MPLTQELDMAKNYGDIFTLVKKAVRKTLGEHRVGLMLYLGNLPMNVGAFHPMGTNDIVLNRRLLNATAKTEPKWRAYVFSILLHEYLHSLGYSEERQVRGLAYKVSVDNFNRDHPVVEAVIQGPWSNLNLDELEAFEADLELERVRDFERIDSRYII